MKSGLRIRVLEGRTVDGRDVYEFPASPLEPEERIGIGRDPDLCRVVFVDDLRHRGLGNEHVALRRSLGRYQLDLNTQNVVLLDGRKTFEEKELRGTHLLRLGDAATLEVTVVDDRTATIGGADADQPHEVTLGQRKLLVGLAAAVAMLAVGGWWLRSGQERLRQETAQVARLVGEGAVPADALERAARSVYLIVAKSDAGGENAVGTGWSAPGGVIVTNAHIAEVIATSPEDRRWCVRSAAPPHREHAITTLRVHPGYAAFRDFVAATKPMQETIEMYSAVGAAPACDVAVLDVEAADALAAPLPIPSRAELEAVQAGMPVATAGFPSEGLTATPVLMAAPVPVRHHGFLVRVTDFFMRQREDGLNQLVQHELPVTGGSSGSPIIDTRGRVIAVHNGGNTLGTGDSGRIISQVVSFAQRADLVLDLLEKTEAEHLADYRAMWKGSLADFQRESEVRLADTFRDMAAIVGRADGGGPTMLEQRTGEAIVAASGEDLRRAVPMQFELQPGVYTVSVAARDAADTGDLDVLVLDARGLPVAADASRSIAGIVRIVNVHPQVYRLVAWVSDAGAAVPYVCTVHDWRCPPDDYLFRQMVQVARSGFGATEGPGFDARTSSAVLGGTPGSTGRGTLEARVPGPGIYMAIGRVAKALPVAMVLADGGQSLDATTSPAADPGDAVVRQTPIVVFRVERPNATVRFACESAVLDATDGPVTIDARVIGWPGLAWSDTAAGTSPGEK